MVPNIGHPLAAHIQASRDGGDGSFPGGASRKDRAAVAASLKV
jgi:hypothetical protein